MNIKTISVINILIFIIINKFEKKIIINIKKNYIINFYIYFYENKK